MQKHHTAIIIGGGPSGSSAACTLARQGIDTCIIDKAFFPRDKLCGGLLTLRSRKIFTKVFDGSWNSIVECKANGVKFFYRNKLLNSVDNYSELFFTRRIDFDNYLLTMAREIGATFYQGTTVASIDLNKNICRLGSGEEISYDYLVGADGVNSMVAKSIFGTSFNKQTIAFALEIEVNKQLFKRRVTDPEIHFGVVRWGYGWIFPKKQTLTIGLGGKLSHIPDIKEEFNQFLKNLFGEIPEGKIKGHYIPFGSYRKTPGLNNALLAGDAAGLVDPITGEGIAFAMESGYLAALSILEAINTKQKANATGIYKEKYSAISRALGHANRLKYLIFPGQSEYFFIKALAKTKRLPLKHLDLMADNINYDEYTRYLIAKIIKGIVKRALFIK